LIIIEFEKEAEEEIDKIYFWYELQKSDLGIDFINHLNTELNFLKDFPKASQLIYKQLGRHLMKKFPYNIYYFYNEDLSVIKIMSVLHESRNPNIWKDRIN